MPKDLRSFLQNVGEKHPEEILRIQGRIQSKWEVTALQVQLENQGRFPLIIAEKATNVTGDPVPYRLITNVLASRRRCAEAIGVSPFQVAQEYSRKTQNKIAPVTLSREEAPVKEVVYHQEEVDLHQFPVVWHHALDPGPYVTAGFLTTVDPESGIPNCSIQRCWIKTRNRTGVFPHAGSHNWKNLLRWWERGEDAPVAMWVGHHPGAYLGGQSHGRIGYPEDHYPLMGGLLEEPLRLVASETFGDQLLVPADAEVVIEGICPRDHYEAEGPFGERPGYTGAQRPSPVMEVTNVTCRKDAYWQDILVGHADNHLAGGFATECEAYEKIRAAVPELLNVYAPQSTGCRDHLYVQVKKTRPGIGRDAALAAIECRPKHAFIFDDDIDIFDERKVLWAIATRSQWDRDLIVVSDHHVNPLDPSVPDTPGIGAKAALDCTRPAPPEPGMPQWYTPVNKVPDEVMEKVKLEDYISQDELDSIPIE